VYSRNAVLLGTTAVRLVQTLTLPNRGNSVPTPVASSGDATTPSNIPAVSRPVSVGGSELNSPTTVATTPAAGNPTRTPDSTVPATTWRPETVEIRTASMAGPWSPSTLSVNAAPAPQTTYRESATAPTTGSVPVATRSSMKNSDITTG